MTAVRNRRIPRDVRADGALLRPLGEWQAAVVTLSAVDAVTTELVRMRCARHHDCHT